MRLFDPVSLAVATIWQEARGEPYEGKVAVGEVIRTRMKKKLFSDGTIEGTVLAPLQFSGWNPRDPNRIAAIRLDSDDLAVRECQGAWDKSEFTSFTKGATHYVNLGIVMPSWYNMAAVTVKIGNHTFLLLG